MYQIESETNLARLGNPSLANLVMILAETGLRVGDATALAFHTVIVDSAGWPCPPFLNSTMGGEQLIPLSAKAATAISDQQGHARRRWPDEPPLLFPRRNANPDGAKPFTVTSVEQSLRRWQDEIGLSNDNGQPVRATPHQFRHTFGTRTINAGVPQHVVQKLLGHASPKMTATYAHLHDTTVREAFEAYRAARVNIAGEVLAYKADAPTAGAEWIKPPRGNADTLPNGLCGRPPQQDCPHPNACLTCPDFQTTPEYLLVCI